MRAMLAPALLWTSAIGCGLTAGVYFAFSAFIMTSLGRIAPASGMVAMNATIVDIVKSPFMPVFMLTTRTTQYCRKKTPRGCGCWNCRARPCAGDGDRVVGSLVQTFSGWWLLLQKYAQTRSAP